jgi:hypothetical protein
MPKLSRSLIALAVIIGLFALIWPKIHIGILIHMTFMQALIAFGVTALILFLLVDHWVNRTRS